MKTNISEQKSKTADLWWYTWDEFCDVCRKQYRTANCFESSSMPETGKDACLECMQEYIDTGREDELWEFLNS